jgi:hypothetical protein
VPEARGVRDSPRPNGSDDGPAKVACGCYIKGVISNASSLRFGLLLAGLTATGCASNPGENMSGSGESSGSTSGMSGTESESTGTSESGTKAATSGAAGSKSGGSGSGTMSGANGGSRSGSGASGASAGSSTGMSDSGINDAEMGDATVTDCITPATPGTCTLPADLGMPICKLSLTGCMQQTNPTLFATSAHPYQVNSPLWSDNAAKTRAFVLPPGGKIHVLDCVGDAGADLASCTAPDNAPTDLAVDNGKWVFPVGSVMIKNFMFNGKFVETRLLMHVDAATATANGGYNWIGYSYAWNETQTEALINPNARVQVMFDTESDAGVVDWRYPDRTDCNTCHNSSNGGGTLGLEMDQMNRVVGGTNQIDTFATLGLFDVAPTKPYPTPLVEPYTNPQLGLTGTTGATPEEEARSYLAVNCGFCHRPDYNDLGFDLRYNLTLTQAGVCNTPAQKPATGVDTDAGGTLLLAPGNHGNSALWIRPHEAIPANADPTDLDTPREYYRMPQLATYVVDPQGTGVIAQWIDSLTTCP